MKRFNVIFALLCVLLFPFCAVAQEITALGFVEDKKAFDLDADYIRLAFVRTNAGWGPSYFFTEDTSNVTLAESKKVTSRIMKKPWQVIAADGKRVDAGTLNIKSHYHWESGLMKTSRSLDGKLKFDSPDSSRYTWKGIGRFPLFAVPTGTQVETILPVVAKEPIKKDIKDKLIKEYLRKERKVYKCNPETEELVSERPALQKEIVVRPQKVYQDDWSCYEVFLPDSSNCGMLDDGLELIAVKDGRIINLSEASGVLNDEPSTTGLTLFNRYVVSTKKIKDTVYVFFVGGYNKDGYALLDSELNMKAMSTWNYH